MSLLRALGGGLAGACALTLLHETTRHTVPAAPRMDVLGMRGLAKLIGAAGAEVPHGDSLRALALGGDVVANTAYYSLVGMAGRDRAVVCGALLGLAAGVGAVALPGPMGLGTSPSNRTTATQAMTVGLYLAGGLAAGLACRAASDGDGDGRR